MLAGLIYSLNLIKISNVVRIAGMVDRMHGATVKVFAIVLSILSSEHRFRLSDPPTISSLSTSYHATYSS
jgi:hypothetical protein